MRFSTAVSLLLAILLAAAAVYGARDWLMAERQQLAAALQQEVQREDVAPAETIVVAAEPIQFGERIIFTTVREIPWSGSFRPEGSYEKIGQIVVEGEENARFAVTPMAVGEPILASKITEPGQRAKLSTALTPGKKAVSIRVNDVLGVAGFVLPGDRVDVLLTRGEFVDVLLQGVRVLAIDQTSDERKDNPSVVRTVTFEVNTEEAQKLVLGGNVGILSLALRNVASSEVEDVERVTISDLSDFDVADDLVETQLSGLPDAEEGRADAADQRLDALEELLKGISAEMTNKLDEVGSKLEGEEPANNMTVGEGLNEAVLVPPAKSTVGVIRNGNRAEYKVEHRGSTSDEDVAGGEDGEEGEVGSQ
ncbi:Flp pilus assembly protein CpaB [Marivita geojedonensis]|uniref:Flp pilus assembly protein CpaB n=1 Tax=Marivita geojedonensis TaxID=1123756 RepID=UPI000A1ED285|nr:Flp pilus assembly protein CpaB [Marivita geojedonensis]PRY72904.1 pilus assembly protein CpaB [Marivita geojedonensis]